MAGALQTAAGVAGGVVLGNMLTNMFSGSHPQEIVNIIDEQQPQQQQDVSPALDNNAAEDPFRQQDDPFWRTIIPSTPISTPASAMTMISVAMMTAGFNPAGV